MKVRLKYLLFEKGVDGQVVQMHIESNGGMGHPLHILIKNQLSRMFDGIMDQEMPDDDGFTEVRFLNASHLEVIDAMRFFGLGVTEVAPTSV